MQKLIPSAAAALIALGLVAGGVSPAMADDAPPADEAATQVEETAPVEEAVDAPVAPDLETDAPTPPVDPPVTEAPAPVDEPEVVDPPVDPPVAVEPEFKTLRWALPEGGTWPQTPFDVALVPCGETVTVQVDVYPYTTDEDKARTDALDDDGLLTEGEDYGWAQSWSFEEYTAPDCDVPNPALLSGSIVVDCQAETVTFTAVNGNPFEVQFITGFDHDADGVSDFGDGILAPANGSDSSVYTFDMLSSWPTLTAQLFLWDGETQGASIAEAGPFETTKCEPPVVVPPTEEPPTEQPPVTEPPTEEEPPAITPKPESTQVDRAATGSTATLAETGSTFDPALTGVAALLLLSGMGVLGIRRLARR